MDTAALQIQGEAIPVWVLHVKQGFEEREQAIRQQMESRHLDFSWVLEHDLPDLTPGQIQQFFSGEMAAVQAMTSCAAKHIQAWENLLQTDAPGALVLEDDILLTDFFLPVFQLILKETESKKLHHQPVLFSLENSGLKFVPAGQRKPGQYLYPAMEMRCAGAYFISRPAARLFLERLRQHKMDLPVDWWMKQEIEAKRVDAFWSHPTIAEQGSHNGKFKSGIDGKAFGWFRKISFALQRWYKQVVRN